MAPDWQAILRSGPPRATAVARLDAPPEAVWAVVGDHSALPRYLFRLLRVTVDNREAEVPDGAGAIRRIRSLGVVTRERVYAREPLQHLAYGLIGDSLVVNHVASLRLEPDGAGTRVTVRQFHDRGRGLRGAIGAAVISMAARRMARGLVAIFGGEVVPAR